MHLSLSPAFSLCLDENCEYGRLCGGTERPWGKRRLLRPDSVLDLHRKEARVLDVSPLSLLIRKSEQTRILEEAFVNDECLAAVSSPSYFLETQERWWESDLSVEARQGQGPPRTSPRSSPCTISCFQFNLCTQFRLRLPSSPQGPSDKGWWFFSLSCLSHPCISARRAVLSTSKPRETQNHLCCQYPLAAE